VSTQDSHQHVVHVSSDGHVHEIWWDFALPGWHDSDLTQLTGAPNAASTSVVGYVSNQDGHQHIIFNGADGHVHEIWWAFANPGWHDADLTVAAGAVSPGLYTNLAAFVSSQDGHQHIIFDGADGHVHELWWAFATPG